MVVWERGAGRTLACGTGACATVVAGVLEGRVDRICRSALCTSVVAAPLAVWCAACQRANFAMQEGRSPMLVLHSVKSRRCEAVPVCACVMHRHSCICHVMAAVCAFFAHSNTACMNMRPDTRQSKQPGMWCSTDRFTFHACVHPAPGHSRGGLLHPCVPSFGEISVRETLASTRNAAYIGLHVNGRLCTSCL